MVGVGLVDAGTVGGETERVGFLDTIFGGLELEEEIITGFIDSLFIIVDFGLSLIISSKVVAFVEGIPELLLVLVVVLIAVSNRVLNFELLELRVLELEPTVVVPVEFGTVVVVVVTCSLRFGEDSVFCLVEEFIVVDEGKLFVTLLFCNAVSVEIEFCGVIIDDGKIIDLGVVDGKDTVTTLLLVVCCRRNSLIFSLHNVSQGCSHVLSPVKKEK